MLNQLFKHTSMQESFSMIFLAVVNGQPKEMGLVQAVRHFIDHRIDVVRRRTAFLLQKARDREHILEGYQAALDRVDDVIRIIRGSENRADARINLVEYFAGKTVNVTEGNVGAGASRKALVAEGHRSYDHHPAVRRVQADAILELQLHRLTRLSIDEILKELAEVRDRIAEYESILGSEKKLRKVIVNELEEIKKKYGDARRTVIQDEAAELSLEDLIADEQVAVTVEPLRLSEAHADLHLSPAAPRRHGPQGHEHARGGFRRAPVRRLDPRLHAGLHQHRPRVLAQGV